jgi:hypothetical protein
MGAPKGNRNAWKHGRRSREKYEALARARALIREINVVLGKSRRDKRPKRKVLRAAPARIRYIVHHE